MAKVLSARSVFLKSPDSDSLDIDVDLAANPLSGEDRHAVFQHLQKKYNRGNNIHVALVGVRTVYSIKSALRDVARTFDIPAQETFAVTKEIEDDLSLEQNKKRSKIFSEYYEKYKEAVEIASQISGVTSNFGVHAGGIIISDRHYPLQRYVPLQRSHSEMPATLYDKDELQGPCGFVKYDILQVTALSQIQYVKHLLNDSEIYSDYNVLPEPFSLCKKGHHKNIFQFESNLGRRSFQELKIQSIYDLANASGMIRQMGTVGGREMYNKYKELSNQDESFWSSSIKNEVSPRLFSRIFPILKPTYGVLIYQEQLANIIEKISDGKYTFGDGNAVRKKLSKFVGKHGLVDSLQGKPGPLREWHNDIMEVLSKYVIPFLDEEDFGKNGKAFINFQLDDKNHLPLPEKGILNWFVIGSTYLFSVIHSVAYSVISYNQMYQKYFYPIEFWLSALHCGSKDDINNYVTSAQSESRIQFLPPHVNFSEYNFSKEGNAVRFGLGNIAGMDKAAEDIINERKERGPFQSFADFLQRTKGKRSVTKKIIENLIFANSFNEEPQEAYDLFCIDRRMPNELQWSKKELVKREFEVLSVNLSFEFISQSDKIGTVSIDSIDDGSVATALFSITSIKRKKSKNGKDYRLLSCKDYYSGNKHNIFLWDNSILLEEGSAYKTKVRKKDGFLTWETR